MRSLKVGYVAYYAKSLAGAELSLLALMSNVKKRGVTPVLICDGSCPLVKKASSMGIKTYVVPLKKYVYGKNVVGPRAYAVYPMKKLSNMMQHGKMKEIIRKEKLDIVHINSSVAPYEWAAVAHSMKMPYVWHLREFVQDDHNSVVLGKKTFTKLMRVADAELAISGSVKEYWDKEMGVNCDLVYNGIDPDTLYNKRNILEGDTINCLIVGRVVEGKGQLEAVKAFNVLKKRGITDIHLNVLGYRGGSDYEDTVKKYIEDNKLEDMISLIDFSSDIKSFHAKNDVGLVCSKREAFGRVTIEYELGGLIVVGSDSGGTPELITDPENGLLYEPGNCEQLADKLIWVRENREKAREIAVRGQENAVNCFSIARTADTVCSIYDRVMSRRSGK